MMRSMTATALALAAIAAPVDAREPIIDMHLHARAAKYAGNDAPPMCAPFATMPRAGKTPVDLQFTHPPCAKPIFPETTDDKVLEGTIAAMKRYNIVGVVSGEPARVAKWRAAAPDRIIPAFDFRLPGTSGSPHVAARTPDELRRHHKAGHFAVLGEMMAQYEGVPANDPRLEPYWALAEELDVPVAIHLGPGEPGQPYHGAYRASLTNPLLLEDVLIRHPKLRLSIMHAAYPMADALRLLLFNYPQVYVDIGSIVYTEPRPAFYAFLKDIVDAGYGDRVMFGSDQMIWPGVIGPSVDVIEQAPFLTEQQKRDIFYNNAARFLRLSEEEIKRHHAL